MNKEPVSKAQVKERMKQRRFHMNESNYEYFPETIVTDHYDNEVYQRVAVYVRVSTDDPRQTTSYELQKQYYEEFVIKHPKWELVHIYADEGISGTSLKHRDQFLQMIEDAKTGKIDLIITKNVSRFARNVKDFLEVVRLLSEHRPPVGVFFESECIYSLNEQSQMALSFQATMAEEESRNKHRSMETSLRMRLDHGLPLTPKLLGFMHDENGKLIINPETAHIPKLMFYMYLYGYSSQQISDALTDIGKITYRGNARWSAGTVLQVLRNERYCGDVYTRKTYTPDVITHKAVKNRGERPRSLYYNEHEAIISRDDYIAVQHMLNNSKYGNTSILPELRVIKEGLLKGFVIINPRWGAFKEHEYLSASASAYEQEQPATGSQELSVSVEPGDFDFSGYEIAALDFFDKTHTPSVTFYDRIIVFNMVCTNHLQSDGRVELLVHPTERKFAVRRAAKGNRNAVVWCAPYDGKRNRPRNISCAAYFDTLCSLFGWDPQHKYKVYGSLVKNGDEEVYIFNAADACMYIKPGAVSAETLSDVAPGTPVNVSGKHIGAVPANRLHAFGKDFYLEKSLSELRSQTKEQWQLRIEGQLFSSGVHLNVTGYDELKSFIQQELGDWIPQEVESDV